MKLGCSHTVMSPTCPPWCGCHGNGHYLATAHCTFSSYGRLEAEPVNQFWWNMVYNSKLGPQWQSHDQILKFLKFKMADGRHVGKYWKCHNSPTNGWTDWDATWMVASHHVPDIGNAISRLPMGPIWMNLGWSHPTNTFAAKPFFWYWSLLLTAQWTFWFYGCRDQKHP